MNRLALATLSFAAFLSAASSATATDLGALTKDEKGKLERRVRTVYYDNTIALDRYDAKKSRLIFKSRKHMTPLTMRPETALKLLKKR